MEKSTLRRADLVFSIILMIISLFIIVNSIGIFFNPFGRDFDDVNAEEIKKSIVQWYKSPALLPLILAAVLFLLGVILLVHARREGARFDFIQKDKVVAFIKSKEFLAFVIIAVLLAAYVFAILPLCRKYLNLFPKFQGFPFLIGTFVFMSAFIIIFNKKTLKKILVSLLVAGCASAAITYAFGNLVLIPLP